MMRVGRAITRLCGNICENRRLLGSLSFKDFQSRFAGSYFGIIWGFVQPLLTMVIYWAVFQFGFRTGPMDGVPFLLWFMCGIVPWLFISESISTSSNALVEYSYLVKKVVFHIDILPLVKTLSVGYIHMCFLALLLLVALLCGYFPTLCLLQLPYYLLCVVVLMLGIGLLTSAIMVFFRDLGQIISLVLLLGMWGTPIAWNPSSFGPAAQAILRLNPIFYLVEGYRDSFIGRMWFWEKPLMSVYFWAVALVVLLVGILVFNRLRPHFADVL